ncbi:alpha/beta hydrolase family protein [Novosphingobium aquimarinum]|uniref:alpha/beta hydrolase family protein n=1 Tax=Novosphingobium aquimarinum TaxID=2682494 RepID=UPI001E43D6A8|nr:S9 family peptidase [Novosphingobium aquimarinum]
MKYKVLNRMIILFGAAWLTSAAPAAAAPSDPSLAERFGALESVMQMSLSPSGRKAAYIGPSKDGTLLFVVDLVAGGAPKAISGLASKDGRLYRCSWLSDERLLCTVTFARTQVRPYLTYSRTFALNADGSDLVQLSARSSMRSLGIAQGGGTVIDRDIDGDQNAVLMTRVFVPESTIGTLTAKTDEGLGVELVDTVNGRRRTVEKARKDASTYISDGRGNVRVMGYSQVDSFGALMGTAKYFYRRQGSSKWEPLAQSGYDGTRSSGFDPYAVDAAKNVVYGFEPDNGYQSLYAIALDGTLKKTKIIGRNDVDIDELLTIGRNERVVGVSYATDRRMIEFFDPELESLGKALQKALPGNPAIAFLDASADEGRLLLSTQTDVDPGMTYVYDKATHKLEAVLPLRSELKGLKLAPMQSVTYRAADGTTVPAYLTLPVGSSGKGLPAIVMPHGGPSARDEWGFDWLVQFYAARGYAVLQPQYRGSAGFGTDWFEKNGFQSWRTAIGDVNDAGRWLVSQGIAAPDKLAIVGWSYGGYAALQSAVLDPDLFKAIVAIAPVTDLAMLKDEAFEYTTKSLVETMIGSGPQVREGSPAQNVERIKAPVLMFHGKYDQNVSVEESRLMDRELRQAGKPVTYVEFPELDHYLLDAAARTRVLSESDAFLRASMKIP